MGKVINIHKPKALRELKKQLVALDVLCGTAIVGFKLFQHIKPAWAVLTTLLEQHENVKLALAKVDKELEEMSKP